MSLREILHSRTAEQVFELLQQLADAGKTVLMVTHDDDMASRARRVITIRDGEIVLPFVSLPIGLKAIVKAKIESKQPEPNISAVTFHLLNAPAIAIANGFSPKVEKVSRLIVRPIIVGEFAAAATSSQ